MKKPHLNFKPPRKLPIFFASLLLLFLTACEKDAINDLEPLTETPTQGIIENEAKTPTGDIELNLALDSKTKFENAASRSATYLIYEGTFSVGQGNWKNFYYTHPQLPDPMVWRIEVTIRPISGNPDLHLYGYDQDLGNPWRYIRGSANTVTYDQTSFRSTDMKGIEERLYMSIYGTTNARFEMTIAAVTVDCQEYPAADQWVTLEYNPVCGCNGIEYPNPSSAAVSGVTSWTVGSCNAIDGYWINNDNKTNGITKMIIADNAQSIHLYGACHPTDCDWETKTLTYDGTSYRATYEHGFATRYVKLIPQLDGTMRMELLNDYHDNRIDRTDVHYFSQK